MAAARQWLCECASVNVGSCTAGANVWPWWCECGQQLRRCVVTSATAELTLPSTDNKRAMCSWPSSDVSPAHLPLTYLVPPPKKEEEDKDKAAEDKVCVCVCSSVIVWDAGLGGQS